MGSRVVHPRHIKTHGTATAYGDGCRCVACKAAYREWINTYRKRPENVDLRRRERLTLFGLTEETLAVRIAAQGGCCAICGNPLGSNRGRGCKTHIDHDHRDSVVPRLGVTVRGILSEGCNQGLGNFNDDPVLLERAAHYVRTQGRFDDWQPGIGAGLV